MLLHEERVGLGRVHGDPVDAMADLALLVRELARAEALVDRLPGFAAVVRAETARRRNRDEHPLWVVGVDEDRMQAEPARAGLPVLTAGMLAQPRELLPALAAVGRLEERRVLDPGEHRVRVVERGLEVPHARKLPRMLRAVVPLVRARNPVVGELVADGLPGLAAVLRPLDDLAVPAGGLRGVQPVRIGRRAVQVVDLPTREQRAFDLPIVARSVRRQDERALTGAHEEPHSAHRFLLLVRERPFSSMTNRRSGFRPKLGLLPEAKLIGVDSRSCCAATPRSSGSRRYRSSRAAPSAISPPSPGSCARSTCPRDTRSRAKAAGHSRSSCCSRGLPTFAGTIAEWRR